jgi:hypothetical protein
MKQLEVKELGMSLREIPLAEEAISWNMYVAILAVCTAYVAR